MTELIQWFPGHMTKALRMMEENVKLCDGIINVLDARAPFACVNKKLIALANNKPVLYVLNKRDFITAESEKRLLAEFSKNGKAIAVNSLSAKECKKVVSAFNELLKDKIQAKKARGINMTVRAMVVGVPNTGKSTLINGICGRKAANVGDKAGVTRGKQWIRLDSFELLDTPGTMPPAIENQKLARHLAYIGCISDDVLDKEELSISLIEEILPQAENIFKDKFGACKEDGAREIIDKICAKRGYIISGGEYDYSRAAFAVIDDFRKGKFGKICLEDKGL